MHEEEPSLSPAAIDQLHWLSLITGIDVWPHLYWALVYQDRTALEPDQLLQLARASPYARLRLKDLSTGG
jgi:hypothetical protein